MPARRTELRSGPTTPDAARGLRRRLARRAPTLALLTALLVAPASGMGQTAPAGPGLDLIVLVDRSASMSGGEGRAPGDPHGLRALLLRLALEVVARSAESNRVSHRLGVVSFGSTARVDLPLAEVRRDDLPRLRREVAAIPSGSLGNTDFLAAFAAAAKLLEALSTDAARQRAVLLVTDGVPYVPGVDVAAYRRELRAFVAAHFLGRQTALEILVLPPPAAARAADRQLWRELSSGRVAEIADDRGDAFAALDRILAGLVGTRIAESRRAAGERSVESLLLPPYLDLVVFDIYHDGPAAEVAVLAPDTLRPLSAELAGVNEVRLGELLSSIAVRRPAPGLWTFRKSHPDTRIKIVSQQFFPRGVLVDPAGEQPLRQYDQVGVAYRVVDGEGSPVQELPGYPLSLELSLVRPDGRRGALAMSRQPELGSAVFRTREQAECELAGRYWTQIRVTTGDLNGRRVQVFEDHWTGFSVSEARRIDCQVSALGVRGSRVPPPWPLWGRPVATRLDCRDLRARPVELRSIVLGSPASLFQPSLFHEGRLIAAALDLEYLGRGSYQGWLHGVRSPGLYRLELAVDRSRLATAYNIRILPAATSFARHLSWLDWALLLASGAAGAAALGWLTRRLLTRKLRKWRAATWLC